MKAAKVIFSVAGLWGIAVLTPFYVSPASLGALHPSPQTDPLFFYGFLAVTMAWQLAFLVIGSDPARYRPLMIPAMTEKFFYVASVLLLYVYHRIALSDVVITTPDFVLGTLFVTTFLKTPVSRSA